MDGRAGRHTPPDRDRPGRAHRRGHRPRPPRPPHRLTPRPDRPAPGVRRALTRTTEETGRHAGRADVLRESTDGSTGR
ncbi:mycothiol transferase [Streptomyces sp. enrichment culture]|uniref:mycothiol transferase n=1 Tax=Streptomyces sp. enrichment culture TaxID=1795815 RepID=UPI003F5711F5